MFFNPSSFPTNKSSPMKPPPPSHSSHASFTIIAVAVIGILATGFLLVSYYIFVIKCCLTWHRIDLLRSFSFSRRRHPVHDRSAAHSPAPENRGLNEAQIRSIPILKFKKLETGEKNTPDSKSCECVVCLNEFQENEKLRIIPNCAHVFHIDCIDIWLQNNANCPLCRTSISARPETHFPSDPDPFSGRDEDYVVIEITRPETQGILPLPRIVENTSSNEVLPKKQRMPELQGIQNSTSSEILAKDSRKKGRKFCHVASMGDEWIDNRKKDEQFVVQAMRRSFSMDSAVDSHLYLAVQEILQQVNLNEGCSTSTSSGSSSNRGKKSFFSLRGSRSAVQPIGIEP